MRTKLDTMSQGLPRGGGQHSRRRSSTELWCEVDDEHLSGAVKMKREDGLPHRSIYRRDENLRV